MIQIEDNYINLAQIDMASLEDGTLVLRSGIGSYSVYRADSEEIFSVVKQQEGFTYHIGTAYNGDSVSALKKEYSNGFKVEVYFSDIKKDVMFPNQTEADSFYNILHSLMNEYICFECQNSNTLVKCDMVSVINKQGKIAVIYLGGRQTVKIQFSSEEDRDAYVTQLTSLFTINTL